MDAVHAAKDIPDKFARVVNHVAKEVVALSSYLGPKAYHFKKIVEGDEAITTMTEFVNRSMMDWDKRSYAKAFKSLSIELDGDIHEFLKVHQSSMKVRQPELVCLFGQVQSPNTPDNNKTVFSHAVEAVLDIKKRYMESLQDTDRGAIE